MADYCNFNKSKHSHSRENNGLFGNHKSDWYWSNYCKAIEWKGKQKIAYWKAYALGLREENRYLLQLIRNLQPGACRRLSFTTQTFGTAKRRNQDKGQYMKKVSPKSNDLKNVQTNIEEHKENFEEETVFEMSEEMIKFFEQSIEHKMNLKKEKEENKFQKITDEEVKQIHLNKLKRLEEMKLLYGDKSSMIVGMETAVQLSFEKYCDTKDPKYWPNIPLNL